jgi:hypothetical protein
MSSTTADLINSTSQAQRPKFYFYMGVAFVAVAFLGFTPTYFVPMAHGTFTSKPIIHIHGMVFFSWTLFYLYQSWLGATGRITRHRNVGMMGISLATAMILIGMIASMDLGHRLAVSASTQPAEAAMFESLSDILMIVALSNIFLFAIFFGIAVFNFRRPEIHKRLMLVATIPILSAPIARWYSTFVNPPGPPSMSAFLPPDLTADVLLLVALVYDWRTRGRPHAAYLISGAFMLAVQLAKTPFSTTSLWHSFANAFLFAVT